jgi:hypothetical protein
LALLGRRRGCNLYNDFVENSIGTVAAAAAAADKDEDDDDK